jgi:aspartate/methionine/tyrosine aminotransferase
MRLAERNHRLGAAGFSQVLAKVQEQRAAGCSVIPMHAGQPDFDTPENVVQAGIQALLAGHTRYAPTLGVPALREAVAADIADRRSVALDPSCVVIMPGAKAMIFHAILALCEKGDEVICPDPCYPIYASLVSFAGATPVSLPFLASEGFRLNVDRLRASINPRTRMIVLNTPCNPTGVMLDASELRVIANLAQEFNLYVLSDEIYGRLTYEQSFVSMLDVPEIQERTILVDGFSKTYAMTGWRLGYGVLPKAMVPAVERLMLNTLSSTNAFIQHAGVEALQGPQDAVDDMLQVFWRRRNLLVEALNQIPGFRCHQPQGAFYVFASHKELGLSSIEISDYLLEEAGVATYAGSTFGKYGEGHTRFSFACSEEDIQTGLHRIRTAIEKRFTK